MMHRALLFSLVFTLVIATVGLANDAEWRQWRGPAQNGSTPTGTFPVRWQPQDAAWKVELPGKGCSTPIVAGGRIFVSAPIEGLDGLLAIDFSGARKWQVTFGPEEKGRHRNGSGCNASPVSDGKGVFVYYKSGTLAAVDVDGTLRWQTDLVKRFGPERLYWDHGTSPVLTERYVVMARMHEGDSWLAAFDKETGELVWKVARNYETPREGDHGYGTPLVIQYQGRESILVWGAQHLTLHDASDGRVVWSCGGFNPEEQQLWPSVASPVICQQMVIVPFGRNDRGIPRLHGIRLAGKGDVTATHRVWKRDDIGTFVPTPASADGRVYIVGDKGTVTCLDPRSGKTIWQGSFPKNRNKFYASPLIAGGRLYAVREDGVVMVADIRDGFQLLAENDMEEPIIASPVPLENGLLIRGVRTLYYIKHGSVGH